MWTNSLRTSVFVAAFLEYLSKGTLISLASTSDALGSTSFLYPESNALVIASYSSGRMERSLHAVHRGLFTRAYHACERVGEDAGLFRPKSCVH